MKTGSSLIIPKNVTFDPKESKEVKQNEKNKLSSILQKHTAIIENLQEGQGT